MITTGIVEIISPIQPGKPPIEPGLVLVMIRLVLGQNSLPVRSDDWMKIGSEFRTSMLGDQSLVQTITKHLNRSFLIIKLKSQTIPGSMGVTRPRCDKSANETNRSYLCILKEIPVLV